MVTASEQPIDLQGALSRFVLEIPPWQFSEEHAREKGKPIWEMIFRIQARDGVAYCFPSGLCLPVSLLRGTEGRRRGGDGKGKGNGEDSYSRGEAGVLRLLMREERKPQRGVKNTPSDPIKGGTLRAQ